MINRLISKKAGISYLQIIILIVSLFAFSYIIYESSLVSGENSSDTSDTSSDISLSCCPVNNQSATCQEYESSVCSDYCAEECIATSCEDTSLCKLGCCYDSSEGICSENSPKGTCESAEGEWSDDSSCNIDECELGCCILREEASFVTEQRCKKLTDFYGYDYDFRAEIGTEIECLALANSQVEGACVFEEDFENTCKLTTKEECLDMTEDETSFHEGYLCSHPDLETNCEKEDTTGCADGLDGVYWYDSCGNRENIYSANLDTSWNSGYILDAESSCNPSESNADSATCGNCNYYLGSVCGEYRSDKDTKPDYGNYLCYDLNCADAEGNAGTTQDRSNGESWCVYDGFVGSGRDTVGSQHYKYYCLDGEVLSEPCADYRTEICVQEDTSLDDGSYFSQASCRTNTALECISYNSADYDGNGTEACSENVDCEMRNFNFGESYEFSLCAPKYPIGFDMSSESGQESAQAVCAVGNFNCTKVTQEGLFSDDKYNEECLSEGFTQAMNDFCASLGDCGGYVNYIGTESDDGYSVTEAPSIDLSQYVQYAEAVAGQFAEPGNYTDLFAAKYGWGTEGTGGDGAEDYEMQWGFVGGIIGASGIAFVVGFALYAMELESGAFIGGFGIAGAAAAVGIAAGMLLASAFGLDDDSAYLLATLGGIGALVILYTIAQFSAETGGWVGLVVAVVLVVIAFILDAMGIGDTEEKTATFTCMPWQAINGGDDCDKCRDGGDLQPCTQYKCESLGQACSFINEGTGYEECVSTNNDDVSSPEISPWEEVISEGYIYDDVKDSGFNLLKDDGSCISEFDTVIFGISTDEASQCKYAFEHTDSYEDMENYFGGSNLYLHNHTMALNLPSVDSLLEEYSGILTDEQLQELEGAYTEMLGDFNLYVRCVDYNGNSNVDEYNINTCVDEGPDLTAPYIKDTEPETGDYLTYGQTSTELKIWTNEPCDCRYDYTNVLYDSMTRSFECSQKSTDLELSGYPCSANLTELNDDENIVYILCKDQPWLETETDEEHRNLMTEPYELKLEKSLAALKIEVTSPENNSIIMDGDEPTSVTLELKTSGGANGNAICGFSFTSQDTMADTFSLDYQSEHTYTLSYMMSGNYTLYFKCDDEAGNIAKSSVIFSIDIDDVVPQVTKAYKSGSSIKIITDEDSSCVYNTDDCHYEWENSTSMSGIQKQHTATWEIDKTYYIKCKDIWDNMPDECSIIVEASDLV